MAQIIYTGGSTFLPDSANGVGSPCRVVAVLRRTTRIDDSGRLNGTAGGVEGVDRITGLPSIPRDT